MPKVDHLEYKSKLCCEAVLDGLPASQYWRCWQRTTIAQKTGNIQLQNWPQTHPWTSASPQLCPCSLPGHFCTRLVMAETSPLTESQWDFALVDQVLNQHLGIDIFLSSHALDCKLCCRKSSKMRTHQAQELLTFYHLRPNYIDLCTDSGHKVGISLCCSCVRIDHPEAVLALNKNRQPRVQYGSLFVSSKNETGHQSLFRQILLPMLWR